MVRWRASVTAGLVVVLSMGCKGKVKWVRGDAAAKEGGGFSVEVGLSDRAKQRLGEGHETLIVRASPYGRPRAGAPARYADEVGGVSLGYAQVEVAPGEPARFAAVPIDPVALQAVDALGPQLLINVYSGRKSAADNLLDCGTYEGPLGAVQGKVVPIQCKLIGE